MFDLKRGISYPIELQVSSNRNCFAPLADQLDWMPLEVFSIYSVLSGPVVIIPAITLLTEEHIFAIQRLSFQSVNSVLSSDY